MDPVLAPTLFWLDVPEARDASLVGNKAATLSRLRASGYPVPNGFCVPSYGSGDLGEADRDEIGQALNQLMPPWVVRSSATAEDSRAYAFPGLFRTVLDVADVRSVYEAIDVVRRSASTPAVELYVAHHQIDMSAFAMAVLIQTLIPATTAGVAFSRDPVTARPGVVIESNYGLGETVVDGSVTPDSITVNRDGSIPRRQIGSKREKVVVTTHRTRVRRLSTSALEREACSLSDDRAREIARYVYRLEEDLRTPVDVEWALTADQLYVLQARPITTFMESEETT